MRSSLIYLIIILAFFLSSCDNPTKSSDGNGGNHGDTIISVTIDPSFAAVEKGNNFQFHATVSGTHNPSQSVVWSVEGSDSSINERGLLSVSVNETAITFLVKATSTVDSTKSGTASVIVGNPTYWQVSDLPTYSNAHGGIIANPANKLHIITFTANISIPPTDGLLNNTFGEIDDLFIIMQGNYIISPTTTGSLFQIGDNQTLLLEGITLQGISSNNRPLVELRGSMQMKGNSAIINNGGGGISVRGGSLFMYDNSRIAHNERESVGGGVEVLWGNLTMQDKASITDNTSYPYLTGGVTGIARGGGVYIGNYSTFVMRDNASILRNKAINNGAGSADGGGVYIAENGTFTMENGNISHNEATSTMLATASGGGVTAARSYGIPSSFVMYNGTISHNTTAAQSTASGGGVSGTMILHDGLISSNKAIAINDISSGIADATGGGMSGEIFMHGGSISGNSVIAGRTTWLDGNVSALGAGVFGQVTMTSGVIFGNRASATNDANKTNISTNGGGVYALGILSKTGGTIYSNYDPPEYRNIAVGGKGHSVYFNRSFAGDTWRNASTSPSDHSDRPDFWLNEIDITYTVIHNNWPPTSLTYTFISDPGNIFVSDILFCDNVVKNNALWSGSSAEKTLSPVAITGNGIITTSIENIYKVFTGPIEVYLIPPPPTNFTTTPSASTIRIDYNPVYLTTGYKIYRSLSTNGSYNLVGTESINRFVNINLQKTTPYYYRVSSYNAAGEGDFTQVSATTLIDNTQLVIPASSSSMVIEWPKDTTFEVIQRVLGIIMDLITLLDQFEIISPSFSSTFRIFRNDIFIQEIEIPSRLAWSIGWPPFTLVQDSNLLDHYYVDTGLSANTTYNYRVEFQAYINIGSLDIPTLHGDIIMTGSATTFTD